MCDHDDRFKVGEDYDLPSNDNGCLACAYERVSAWYKKSAECGNAKHEKEGELARVLGWRYLGLATTFGCDPNAWMPPEGGRCVLQDDLGDRLISQVTAMKARIALLEREKTEEEG